MAATKFVGAAELIRLLEAKDISAVEYAKDTIEREEQNKHLNAVMNFDRDLLINNAQHADEKRARGQAGQLCGVPVIVKDNINTVAFPTTGCTGALLDHTPETNAGVITALCDADAYVAAKSGMHELAFGITCNNAVTGAVRNPHDPDKIPGGSSGGSAAAVAAGVFPVGLGTDTGGSVRLPAALCGIVGFRPTVGRYADDGVIPISHTRDTVGPLARNMEDITLMDSVLSGKPLIRIKKDLSSVTLGLPKEVFFENLEPAVETAVQSVLKLLEGEGVKLVEVSLAELWPLNEAIGFPVALYEVMQELPAYLKQHAPDITFEKLVSMIRSPDVAGIIGSQLGNDKFPDQVYHDAMQIHRPAMQAMYKEVFKTNGLTAIVFPTAPLTARNISEDETVDLNGEQVPTFPTFIRNTDLGSNLGVPGISLPCSNVSGLPVGIEFDGLANADEDLIELALAVEEAMTK